MLFVPLGTMQSNGVAMFRADSFVVPTWEISHNQADTVLNNSSELTSCADFVFNDRITGMYADKNWCRNNIHLEIACKLN